MCFNACSRIEICKHDGVILFKKFSSYSVYSEYFFDSTLFVTFEEISKKL